MIQFPELKCVLAWHPTSLFLPGFKTHMMSLLPRRNPPLATVPTKNILPNPNAPRTAQVTVEGARKSAQRHRPNSKLSAVSPIRLHLFLSKTRLTPRSQASSRPRSDSPPKDLHLWMRESTPKVMSPSWRSLMDGKHDRTGKTTGQKAWGGRDSHWSEGIPSSKEKIRFSLIPSNWAPPNRISSYLCIQA